MKNKKELLNYETAINDVVTQSFNFYLNQDALHQSVSKILECLTNHSCIHMTGIGKPSYVAKYGASLFSSIGVPCFFLDGTEAVHGSSGQIRKQDIVIALSNSGETSELLATLKTIKTLGATIISITSNKESSVGMLSDYHITTKSKTEGGKFNKAPRASIIGELLVIQYMSILLQEGVGQTIEDYLLTHPGGSLGKQK